MKQFLPKAAYIVGYKEHKVTGLAYGIGRENSWILTWCHCEDREGAHSLVSDIILKIILSTNVKYRVL